jgi:WD40 repeat protein
VSGDQTGVVNDVITQQQISELHGHEASIKSITKCEEKGLVITGGRDGKIILYDIRQRYSIGEVTNIGDYTFT